MPIMLSEYSTEAVARAIRQDRRARAVAWALADEVPSRPRMITYAALASITMGLLSALAMYVTGS